MIHALLKQIDCITGRVTWLIGRAAEIAIDDGSCQRAYLKRLARRGHISRYRIIAIKDKVDLLYATKLPID